ncbi:MAG TPA: transposase [Streptosporangiaceae bacterium]|nr:transposase [Streptosporangiaceae bacterium]
MCARQELTTTAAARTNRLRALLRDGDDAGRDLARGYLGHTALAALARRRPPSGASRAQAVRHAGIRRLAVALRDAARQVKANYARLAMIVSELAPGLTSRCGIGPVSAAQAIVSFSHPGRCRHQAAFAALGGTSPIEASSGQTTRHRLNRGGDRALNQAIHVITTTRMRRDPATIAYVTRRRAEGKTNREIRRCLKRYIARQPYRALTTAMTPPSPDKLTA